MKFPKDKKLRGYLLEVTEAVVMESKNSEALGKQEQAAAEMKKDLFALLPVQTKKNILLQASGKKCKALCR